MGSLRKAAGPVAVLVGVLIALVPFISVSRAGATMLAEVPVIDGVEHVDDHVGWSAMFDDEFVLASRTFRGVSEQTVMETMAAAGFEPLASTTFSTAVSDGFSKECCGDYDAVWASVETLGDGQVQVELTAADSDWQQSWPLFSGFGVLVALMGVGLHLTGRAKANLAAPPLEAPDRARS